MRNITIYHTIKPLLETESLYKGEGFSSLDIVGDLMEDFKGIMSEEGKISVAGLKEGKFVLRYSLKDFKRGSNGDRDKFIERRFESLEKSFENSLGPENFTEVYS